MKIKRVIIENFKQFSKIDFTLDNMNIIVGKNGSGKTTIAQALFLAITGKFNNKTAYKEICESMFFNDTVKQFIDKINRGQNVDLPKISISIWFDDYPELNGSVNDYYIDGDGFTFSIEMDEKFGESWQEFLKSKAKIDSIPLEYYHCVWKTFSGKKHPNTAFLKFRASLINVDSFQNNSSQISSYLSEILSDDQRARLTQDQREAFKEFAAKDSVKAINNEVSKNPKLLEKKVMFSSPEVKNDTWFSLISLESNGIPFDFEGDGVKRLIKTYISGSKIDSEVSQILIIEEPESHLSYTNLWILVDYLNELSKNCQLVVTTHSSFVANKLNLSNILLLSNKNISYFKELPQSTCDFFRKRASYDSLRLILSEKVVLVEGDSDDLIFQKAFFDNAKKDGKLINKLPSDCGVDTIAVSLAFSRFLDLAKLTGTQISVITDNDGDVSSVKNKYNKYISDKIKIFYSSYTSSADYGKGFSSNTLEPELFRVNSLEVLNNVFGLSKSNETEIIQYMESNKTDCALTIFDNETVAIKYPQYILDAVHYNEE